MLMTVIKIVLSLVVILTATFVARVKPSFAGLIGVMPLTGALVVIWVFFDNKENPGKVLKTVEGSLYGILPTILFFGVVLLCLKGKITFPIAIIAGFAVWVAGAFVHQYFLK